MKCSGNSKFSNRPCITPLQLKSVRTWQANFASWVGGKTARQFSLLSTARDARSACQSSLPKSFPVIRQSPAVHQATKGPLAQSVRGRGHHIF